MNEKTFTAKTIVCPTCKTRTFIQDQPWKLVCVSCYMARKTPSPKPTTPTALIEPDMMRRLLQLCHPDKHANSQASNTATTYLLGLRHG